MEKSLTEIITSLETTIDQKNVFRSSLPLGDVGDTVREIIDMNVAELKVLLRDLRETRDLLSDRVSAMERKLNLISHRFS